MPRLLRASAGSLWLLLIFLLASCSPLQPASRQGGTAASLVEPVKSGNDQRQYRYLVLPNKLKVLLVSDPNTDKSAAALDVFVGSSADPQQLPGLAHFLEHMLFLGTKKYPKADEYQSFVTAHGGSNNAYTSFEHTNYYFDIDPQYFGQTLDRFAQFFISPLFTEQYVEREKHAINSEFMSRLKDDQRRSLDAFKAVINPQHPFSRFSVGNLQTLKVDGDEARLRSRLIEFYRKHYSANIMTLVVLGKESLPELEKMVRTRFDAIPNRDKTVPKITEPLFSPDYHGLPLYLQVKPEKRQRTLSISFPTPEAIPYYRDKPLQYLANILGHEGRGSLLSLLKEKGWAEGLSAGAGFSYRGGATFEITIKLSRGGVKHVDDIITEVFQTLNRIRQTPNQRWLYEEQKQLAQQQFRYQEGSAPIHYVTTLSTGMQYYKPKDTLRGPYMMADYDQPLIDRFLAAMVPANSMITLIAPEASVDRQTHYYKTPYSVSQIAPARLQHWQQAGLNNNIRLPQPNPFIARNLDMKTPQFNDAERKIYEAKHPQLIHDEPGYKLWYKSDKRFQVPRASVLVSVKSPVASDSAAHHAMLGLYTALVADRLNELSYPAYLAGLDYSIDANSRGFLISISGYNDKQQLLLDDILRGLKATDFDRVRFEHIKHDYIRHLENTGKQQPYKRVIDRLSRLLYRNMFPRQELLEAYRSVTLKQLIDYQRQFFAATDLKVLVHGNYRESEAETLGGDIRAALLHTPYQPETMDVARLDKAQYRMAVKSDYSDSALLLYIQGAGLDKKDRVALGVTSQMLRSDFYNELRTEKQLGYIVTSGIYPVRDVPGIFFLVQSPVVGVGTLQKQMKSFLNEHLLAASKVTEADFDRVRQTLIQGLSEEPKNLWGQSQKYWRDISQHYYRFDSKQQLIAALQSLTLAQWQEAFRQQVASLDRAVWIHADGKFKDDSAKGERTIDDLSRVKQQLRYYRFP